MEELLGKNSSRAGRETFAEVGLGDQQQSNHFDWTRVFA